MPNIRPINAALAEKAKIELNEIPEKIQDDLDAIKAWIAKQPHLFIRTDDQFLMIFLRGCKYRMQKVKEKLENYFNVRIEFFNFYQYQDRNNLFAQELIRSGIYMPLPFTAAPDSPRIILCRSGYINMKKFDIQQYFQVTNLLFENLISQDDNSNIAGVVLIIDMRQFTMDLALQMQSSPLRKYFHSMEKASAVRVKSIHYIYTPSILQKLITALQSITNGKYKKRLYFYDNDLHTLYEHVPRHLLPAEYGGQAGTIPKICDDLVQSILTNQEWFLEDEKYSLNYKKKFSTRRQQNNDTLYGTAGSFQSLQLD